MIQKTTPCPPLASEYTKKQSRRKSVHCSEARHGRVRISFRALFHHLNCKIMQILTSVCYQWTSIFLFTPFCFVSGHSICFGACSSSFKFTTITCFVRLGPLHFSRALVPVSSCLIQTATVKNPHKYERRSYTHT